MGIGLYGGVVRRELGIQWACCHGGAADGDDWRGQGRQGIRYAVSGYGQCQERRQRNGPGGTGDAGPDR